MTYREEWKDFIKRELVIDSFGTEVKLQEYYEKSFEQNQPVIKELIENELSNLLQGEFNLTIQKDSITVDYPKLEENNLFFDDSKLMKHDIIYARASSPKQKQSGELEKQVEIILKRNHNLQNPIILKEIGSGLNEQRPKLQQLLKMVLNNEVNKIYITHKDRLTIFGFNYLKYIFEEFGVEIVILYEDNYENLTEKEKTEINEKKEKCN